MGIGDWGLGIGDWGLGPIPNPHLLNDYWKIFNFYTFYIKYYLYSSKYLYLKTT